MPTWGAQIKYGDYEIVGARDGKPRLLGKGSFGKTFEAVRVDSAAGHEIKEYVAVKVLDPAVLTSAANRFQFIQEVMALTRFKHSNLIHYARCGEQGGEVYYAMELCRGGDLSKLVRRFGPLQERTAALIALQVVSGLREVHHRHRLVHRDIKPSNIMLVDEIEAECTPDFLAYRFAEQESLCRVVDFGLVNFILNAGEAQRFAGSPMYASPEQIQHQPVDGRSDIYSLGMTIWYLLLGKGPLLDAAGEEVKSKSEAMARHTAPEEHEPNLPRNISAEFRAILARMVAKRAENRYASAAEVQTALRAYLGSAAVPAPPGAPASVEVLRINAPIDAAYAVTVSLPSRRAYLATEKSSGARVKLNAVADLHATDPAAIETITAYLCELVQLSRHPGFPPAILPVRNVVLASDTLACTEEMAPHLALADVLRGRAAAKRSVTLSEAVACLRPIAEGLDFLLANKQSMVLLPCEDVWLTSAALSSNLQDAQELARPLTDWQEFQVHFSMVCLRVAQSDASDMTVSGSVQLSDIDLHPVPVFVRLVYRILTGSEVAAATAITPNAYTPTVALGNQSNILVRDILCQRRQARTVTAVLRELCLNEGIPWRSASGRAAASSAERSVSLDVTVTRNGVSAAAGTSIEDDSIASSMASGFVPASTERFNPASSLPATAGDRSGATRSQFPSTPPPMNRIGPPPLPTTGGASGTVRPIIDLPSLPTPAMASSPPSAVTLPPSIATGSSAPGATTPPAAPPFPSTTPPPLPAAGSSFGSAADPASSAAGSNFPTVAGGAVASSLASSMASSLGSAGASSLASAGASSLASENPATSSISAGEKEQICEIVHPGLVISPDDPSRTEQTVPAAQWVASGRIRCQITKKFFRLPRKLDPLVARVVSPGMIESPYALGSAQHVPWESWIPGAPVLCTESGRRIALPMDLPPPEAALAPGKPGLVVSPYDPQQLVAISPDHWEPGLEISCPSTHHTFRLPAELPPLEALATLEEIGVVANPYIPAERWRLDPPEWAPGRLLPRETNRPLVLPVVVGDWAAIATLNDASRRLLNNPYRPGATIEIPAAEWAAGGRVYCVGPDDARRVALLPESLPPLSGELLGSRTGVIRSPYSGAEVPVPIEHWESGCEMECPATSRVFVLPPSLPEWLPEARLSEIPGKVRSPFEPFPEMTVAVEEWLPKQALECPATGRRFRLPDSLPLLEGHPMPGSPGRVLSPFASTWQTVPPEEWTPGARLICSTTKQPFALPAVLEEWILEGVWEPGAPGKIRSPYGPRPTVEISAAQWQPSFVLACPATGRKFRLPAPALWPPLALEHAAVEFALSHIETSPEAAAQVLQPKFSEATPEQVQDIWQRHRLASREDRERSQAPGEAVPDQPGKARSPYGARPVVEVPAADWKPGASIPCPETGLRFRLPPDLPPLVAVPDPQKPGMVTSPYAPAEPFQVTPDLWKPNQTIRCPTSGQSLRLPATLPQWIPVGAVNEGQPGVVFSPYGRRRAIRVRGADWKPGASAVCLETGFQFSLPQNLPPMTAAAPADKPGRVLSPYSDREVAVPKTLWQPGGNFVCPETGRIFLLPASLPPFPQGAFPWKPLALAVVVVALLGAGWQFIPKPHSVNPPGGNVTQVTPVPHDPDPKPEPSAKTGPIMASFASLKIEDWKKSTPPPDLQWSAAGAHGSAHLERNGEAFQVSFELPESQRKQSSCAVEFTLPGWASLPCGLSADGQGGFSEPQMVIMKRATAVLPLELAKNRCDYDAVTAVWVRPLPDQPSATPPAGGSIRQKIGADLEGVGTGVYHLQLDSKTPESFHPLDLGEIQLTSQGTAPIKLPPSIAGDYWGMVSHSPTVGFFLLLHIGEKLSVVETRLLELPRANKVYHATDVRPFIGDIWNVTATAILEKPTALRFSSPFRQVRLDWLFEFGGAGGKSTVRLFYSPRNDDLTLLQDYMTTHLNDAAEEIKRKEKASASIYQGADLGTFLASGQRIESLQRYKDVRDGPALKARVNTMKSALAASPDIHVEMFPASTVLYEKPTRDGNWGIDTKPYSPD